MKKKHFHNCLATENKDQSYSQLSLFNKNSPQISPAPKKRRSKTEGGLFEKRQKAQIESIPGLPGTHPNRYQVKLGDEILGKFLGLDEALALAKRGNR